MTTPVTDLSSNFADLVARLRRAMRRAARAAQPAMTLSVAQLELLSVIGERPGSRPGELAQVLRLAPNSISTLANSLTVAGMLERASNAADRRAVTYSLTSAGVAQVTSWRQTNITSLTSALAALTPQEQQIITIAMPVMNRLVTLLDEHTDHTNDDGDPRVRPIG
ncbi:MarR family winged helix-turn-helix transcriptional regulator [Pedococcus bigeumensis]|uniref:MarR family transcriptional regulator n=1 Tax=Pedococcus bigeumensis TaxID=433644 RepID=A0A502CUA8_9MICO|nr:MarR family winged helix-turn-helix transcriptional regulator [Pedococcus bigeumensis]TPG16817.1 MarR family transcriptional regulator [Pedococcus bigeumensis]